MQRLEVSCAARRLYTSLDAEGLKTAMVAVLVIIITVKFVEAARDSLYCQATFMVSVVSVETFYL